MRNRPALPRALALSLLLVGAAPATDPAATVDALLGGERVRIPLAALAERAPLAPEQEFRVVEVGRDAATSHHVVAIRTAETPHRHDRHELLVMIVRGHGTMRIGDAALAGWRGQPALRPARGGARVREPERRARGRVRDLLAAVRREGPPTVAIPEAT